MTGGWAVEGALAGLGVGVGITLTLSALRARRIRLDERVSPYLRAHDSRSALLATDGGAGTGAGPLVLLLRPARDTAVRVIERLGSSHADVERRLRRAGSHDPVEAFRTRQVIWAVVGITCGLALSMLLAVSRGVDVFVAGLLVAVLGVVGALACDHDLTRRARRHEARMQAEFPAVAELLALAVGAGEGPLAAIDRVARTVHGALAREFVELRARMRSGVPLAAALEGLAERTELPTLTRFARAVAVAVERGTPIADVLRAQAQDVRESGRRELMEQGGKKEIAMLVPVVFLVLPVTVVFALYPGLVTLRIGL
ncbi:pilus assembly protein TadB [Paraoerskovia sediminicola]|uniref:Pilus assembly protein TadB n=1 Tax=Paraoerskovia sediminicola TaxID=1138587 RepID=A0ABM8FZ42_9CELL|nr:type II secretion system F family protein [Paraoerskovia sediminicola]BDZ40881.1 pilus assembly protein TadB [Paraoerskovia sediminicola]